MSSGSVPRVSVIMPVYNAERYLREAIDSILNQKYTDLELIIINDGSKDSSKEIILSYEDPRIVYLENKENSGICVTLNNGLDVARGEFIARMDSDDIALPERLHIQVDYLDTHKDIGIVGSDIEVFGEGINSYFFEQVHDPDLCAAGLLFNPCFAHPTVMWRKKISDKYNLRYDPIYKGFEDERLWWEFAKVTGLANINKVLLRYRKHKWQETVNTTPKQSSLMKQWRRLRFESFVTSLSERELELTNNYCCGRINNFSENELFNFAQCLKRIRAANRYPIKVSRHALKTVSGRAVVYIILAAPRLRQERRKLLIRLFKDGYITFEQFYKFFLVSFK
ncbi:MAG: glycosyltransferase family 2 protein [Bacteroides sp.]|nr:glycosyltransferase family 2 protein [Bacteroides sp.]